MTQQQAKYFSIKRLFEERIVVISTMTATLLVILNLAAGFVAGTLHAPGASGLVTGLTVPFFLVMLSRTTNTFGTMALAWTVYSTISIPLHLMGPPNIFKPFFGLLIALAFELPVLLFRQRKYSYYVGLLTYTLAIVGMAFVAFAWLNLPGSENAYKYVWWIALVFFGEGCISVAIAHRVYEKNVMGSRLDRFFG